MNDKDLLKFIEEQLAKTEALKQEGSISEDFLLGYSCGLRDIQLRLNSPQNVIKRAEENWQEGLDRFGRRYIGRD